MSFKSRLLLLLAALLLTAPLALLAAPPEAPQTLAITVAQPPAAFSPAGPACKGGDLPLFSPARLASLSM